MTRQRYRAARRAQQRGEAAEQRRRELEACLARLVLSGQVDARPLSQEHWLVWNRADRQRTRVHFWPRSGACRAPRPPHRKLGQGWSALLFLLRLRPAEAGGKL